MYPTTAPIAYVASGEGYADALSAGPAAAKAGGPLLLTSSGLLPASTATELSRIRPAKVVVVGGAAAVSDAVVAGIRRIVPDVVRVAGADRYATSRAVVASAFSTADNVIIASGDNYPDAVATSGAAVASHGAVLLVPAGQTSVDPATRAMVATLKVKSLRVAGGTTAMPAGIYNALSELVPSTQRLSGADRWETSVAVNVTQYRSRTAQAVLVSGLNFPDALYAGTFAGGRDVPLYLSSTDCVPQNVINDMTRLGVSHVVLIGGEVVLTPRVAALVSCSPIPGATNSVPPVPVQQFSNYQIDNPDNLAGQDQLAMKLFNNHLWVRFDGATDFVTGTQAQAQVNAAKAALPSTPGTVTTKAARNLFKVWVVKVNTLWGWQFGGHWEFDPSFAGQTNPDDVATLQFKIDKCAKLSNLQIRTRDYYGKDTHLGYLKDANLGRNAPIFGIQDHTKGFINQAHSGTALAWLSADNCPGNHYEGQAAFVYQAVEGGAVASVSAGWGAFSVSLNGQTVDQQRSTQPFDFVY